MKNISLEKYFQIFEFMHDKDEKHFREHKQLSVVNYNDESKIEALEEYYDAHSQGIPSKVFNALISIKKVLIAIVFAIIFIFNLAYFNNSINLKIYLLCTILIPLLYSAYVGYQLLTYRSKLREERSYLYFLTSLIFKNKNIPSEHSHIFKAYANLSLADISITYSVANLVSTVIIFWAFSVTFYTENTYDSTGQHNSLPQDDWSLFITLALVVLVILKCIVRLFIKPKMTKAICQNLEQQNKPFFNIMRRTVMINKNTDNTSAEPTNQATHSAPTANKILLDSSFMDYYLLYYNLDKEGQDKIIFHFDENKDLLNKSSESYPFALFGQDKEDRKTIGRLSNLVLIFASPESSPDNTFKDDIHCILSNEYIKQIWILPLSCNQNSSYELIDKHGTEYAEWARQINTVISNKKVTLYHER